MRQLCLEVEREINRAQKGQRWGAAEVSHERTRFSGIGTIRDVGTSVALAVVTVKIIYRDSYA